MAIKRHQPEEIVTKLRDVVACSPDCPCLKLRPGLVLARLGPACGLCRREPLEARVRSSQVTVIPHSSIASRACRWLMNMCSVLHSSRSQPMEFPSNSLCSGLPGATQR